MIYREVNKLHEHIKIFKKIDSEKCLLLIDRVDNTKYCLLKEENKWIMKRKRQVDECFTGFSSLTLDGKIFFTEEDKIINITSSMSTAFACDYISYLITSFETNKFKKNKYFQAVFDNSKKGMILDFIFDELISVSTERYKTSMNGIKFEIKGISFSLYFVNNYLIIENSNEVSFDEFDKYLRITLMCFGLLNGYVPRDECHFFSYTNNDFLDFEEYAYSSSFIATYDDVHHQPLNKSLFYNFIENDTPDEDREQLSKKYLENLFLITNEVFSNLCELCFKNKKITRAVELIMEGNQASIEAQGIVYSVVLEILTGHISEKLKSPKPIENKKEAKKLREELHMIAKKYVSPYRGSIIFNKINNLNSPTNKDKLIKPFELLKIPLTDIDKDIIERRNDFLHGNEFIKKDNLWDYSNEHLFINFKLHYLIHALLFKLIGHKGKITNLVKVHLDGKDETVDEDFYRDIGVKWEKK